MGSLVDLGFVIDYCMLYTVVCLLYSSMLVYDVMSMPKLLGVAEMQHTTLSLYCYCYFAILLLLVTLYYCY